MKQWTNHEHNALKALFERGYPKKFIAAQLGRSLRSVQSKACTLSLVKRRRERITVRRPFVSGAIPETVKAITPKDDLPAYYALGWRVAWFEGNQVGLEWKYTSAPRTP